MSDVISAFFEVIGISLVGLILAGWYSVDMLEGFSVRLRRFHEWAQLRIHARGVGLTAYRDAHSRALREGSNPQWTGDAASPDELGGAAEGLGAQSY
jgi:hypothetical protein